MAALRRDERAFLALRVRPSFLIFSDSSLLSTPHIDNFPYANQYKSVKRLTKAQKMRIQLRVERDKKLQEEKEERLYARWLLFCKGLGQSKNLKEKEKLFVRMVAKKAYERYLSDLILSTKTGVHRRPCRPLISNPARPFSFHTFRKRWYGSQKGNYRKFDVPMLVRMRWEARNGGANSEVQELGGRYMQQLRHEISERERRDLDLQVPELPVRAGGVEGLGSGQKQLRERGKAKAGNRREDSQV